MKGSEKEEKNVYFSTVRKASDCSLSKLYLSAGSGESFHFKGQTLNASTFVQIEF
jgi:hypothetical protein